MLQTVRLHDWLTLSGPDTNDEVTQECEEWVDNGVEALRFCVCLEQDSDVALIVQTITSVIAPQAGLCSVLGDADECEGKVWGPATASRQRSGWRFWDGQVPTGRPGQTRVDVEVGA